MINEIEPKGKRTVRRTVRGSLIGYIGRTMWVNFGEAFEPHAEQMAEDFLAGKE